MPAPPIISNAALHMATDWMTLTDAAIAYGWLYLDMVVHELGHCSVSLALGSRLIGVRFGKPILMTVRGKRVRYWMFGCTPYGGASIRPDRPALSGRAEWLITVAGPMASAAMGLIAIGAYHLSPSPATWLMCYFSAFSVFGGFFFALPSNSDARKIWRGILNVFRGASTNG